MARVNGWFRRAGLAVVLTLGLVAGVSYIIAFAQSQTPQTFVVRVNPDGTQLADGGGYTTQFILFSGIAEQTSAGSLILVQQSGQPWVQTLVAE